VFFVNSRETMLEDTDVYSARANLNNPTKIIEPTA
jgi:hypothetical protein